MTKIFDTMISQLYVNGRLVGMEEEAQEVMIKDGKVEWIGSSEHRPTIHDVEIVDVEGSWIAPSMIDWHVHSKLAANYDHRVHLSEETSAQAVFLAMRKALDDPKFDTFELVGVDMRNGNWNDNHLMNRATLDKEVSSTRPIYLFYNGYHTVVANSVGLERYKIKSESGILHETEGWDITYGVGQFEDEVMDKWISTWANNAASLGITEIVDLEIDFNIRDWQRRCKNGFDTLRVHTGIYDPHFPDAVKRGVKSGDVVPETNGLVTVGPYKIVTDGGLGSQTAFCHDAYPDTTFHGIFSFTATELEEMTQRATNHGFKLAIHAIGDQANSVCLKLLASNPVPPLNGSTIEHAQLLNLDDIEIFNELGLIASVQPKHLVDDRETCLKYWPGREHRAWALKSLADAGVAMKFGSDSPVAEMDPWEAMAVAVSRRRAGGLPLSEEQAVDVRTAWVSSTSNGRLALQVGDKADMVIIDRNPLECDATGLRATTVFRTILGGRCTYRRA
ncbi:uncharacterized protein IL334_005121 [Kwoniella shivajii]|uniref:Amidohydrolase 3 domain-containing protein n=1 Tax=Kwoniella shivajii TaxID=564305 RepID=A0ABZ1D2Q9_9TREE|nr:hypothetical protein IL334_005121 [Kwoniella shivajii]